jgi:putative hydrolase of the HAD superfamily
MPDEVAMASRTLPVVDEPKAVLLDVGGVLFLPDHDRLLGAMSRAGFAPPVEALDRAHYAGAAALDEAAAETGWPHYWSFYLDAFLTACDVPDELRAEALDHLSSEHAVSGLWTRIPPGAREGLEALGATGVCLGIVSNSDGSVEAQLREYDLAQVGPGPGIEVECVIDSTVVGVSKPDPRIFELALDAMGVAGADSWYVGDTPAFDVLGARRAGLRAFLLDPYQQHLDMDCDRVASLTELAELIRA